MEKKMQSIREIFKYGFGPSSSHTIGPGLAAQIFKNKNSDAFSYRVTLYGSLSATGKGHNTDITIQKILDNKTEIIWDLKNELPFHPNGMLFEAINSDEKLIDSWEVFSVGGGDLKDAAGRIPEKPRVYQEKSLKEILACCRKDGHSLWEYVMVREGGDIQGFLDNVWVNMKSSIQRGLDNEGVLPGSLHLGRKASSYFIKAKNSQGSIYHISLLFAYALAVSEENASGNSVVTAPTCGSAGVLPAVLYFLQEEQHLTDIRIIHSLATAGLIGNLVKTNASISGAEVGCQGEIGTACAMAAAAAAQLMGGTPSQIEYAAEMGFEHNLGLTCDPIRGYVQIPCIERNAIASGKALECATYALFSDGEHKISFDQVVATMKETGKDLQSAYRETGIGGLARNYKDEV
jgi:L-serine dehydratase